MGKVIGSLPSVKQIIITLVICLILGVIVAGFHPRAFVTLVTGVIFLALLTVRNYDLIKWEAYHNPVAHSLRSQRDEVVEQLRLLVDAFDKDDRTVLVFQMSGSRHFLLEKYPPQ